MLLGMASDMQRVMAMHTQGIGSLAYCDLAAEEREFEVMCRSMSFWGTCTLHAVQLSPSIRVYGMTF